jgi:hypothetical protein
MEAGVRAPCTAMPVEINIRCKECGSEVATVIEAAPEKPFLCPHCGETLFKARTVEGYLYILSNAEMPGLLKIGITIRSVTERVAELSSTTGVPVPFTVEAHFESRDPKSDEAAIHKLLAQHRVPGREFFRVTLADALKAARSVTGTEPLGAVCPTVLTWKVAVCLLCETCSREFWSTTSLCTQCGGLAHRLAWPTTTSPVNPRSESQ